MENPKSKIAKSKSSNITVTTERQKEQNSDSARKKSKSNAEFQTLMVKKRGVYVEKKISLNERANESKAEEVPAKPPPRPRPGSKRFLASVLTILSKSTTATQFPDNEDETKVKAKKSNAKDPKSALTNPKKKSKFRSKILNNENYENDKFEVIQNKKEIVLTPSIYSEKSFVDDLKRRPVKSDLDDGWKARECENIRENDDAVTGIVKEVIEGRMNKKVKLLDAEPTTLVSEHKNDNLYNFFVNLLETTISVCNMKAQCDAGPIPSGKSSNVAFEIDESVVKKLNVGTEMLQSTKPKQFCCIQNDNNWNEEKVTNWAPEILLPELPKYPPKQRKTNSFAYTSIRRRALPPPQSKSVVNTKKTSQKKNKKKNLLNILKEQLAVEIEEPQNLYEALRVMAKNKKKKEKTIRFDMNSINEGCMLKPRKVISRRTKSSSKYEKKSIPTDDAKKADKLRRKFMIEQLSNHSLEVYDFDYDIRPKKRQEKEKQELLTNRSSSFDSQSFNQEFDTDSETTSSLITFNV